MLRGWKLSVVGIAIVGVTAVVAPLFEFIPYGQSITLFILFVLFVGCLELLEWLKRRRYERNTNTQK